MAGGLTEAISLDEIADVYVPLVRLLDRRAVAHQHQLRTESIAVTLTYDPTPYVIGIAGSVAVGKSTTARVLRTLLASVPGRVRRVELVSTDGFLHPNADLEARGLIHRKGFPESYDVRSLRRFLEAVKAGVSPLRVPVYSHLAYDILPGEWQVVAQPDVLIVEGLNVLQPGPAGRGSVADAFDFSIYVDAEIELLREWYVSRFLRLRDVVFRDPASYFHRYAALTVLEARRVAMEIWETINEVNLLENILPTRQHADLILEKGPDHAVQRVRVKRGLSSRDSTWDS